ncbi:hypothetical protein M5K25_016113 [Dendrobium thyrsiflorum]|uniref:Uncharacterized protein n=1 Tax=Dendrobium thyrsiflorum TaxID=117978 RepID=A0ABD0US85_DENTH
MATCKSMAEGDEQPKLCLPASKSPCFQVTRSPPSHNLSNPTAVCDRILPNRSPASKLKPPKLLQLSIALNPSIFSRRLKLDVLIPIRTPPVAEASTQRLHCAEDHHLAETSDLRPNLTIKPRPDPSATLAIASNFRPPKPELPSTYPMPVEPADRKTNSCTLFSSVMGREPGKVPTARRVPKGPCTPFPGVMGVKTFGRSVIRHQLCTIYRKGQRITTTVLGMNVSHSSPEQLDASSIAAIVSPNQRSSNSQYKVSVGTQSSKVEMIDPLFKPTTENDDDDKIKELLIGSYTSLRPSRPSTKKIHQQGHTAANEPDPLSVGTQSRQGRETCPLTSGFAAKWHRRINGYDQGPQNQVICRKMASLYYSYDQRPPLLENLRVDFHVIVILVFNI